MTEWNDELKARLMAYCRIDALEEGEELLLQGLYNAAVGYMEQAGVSEPKEDTPRRAQYDLCVNALVLDGYDRRGMQTEGSVSDNPQLRRMIVQLKLTEPAVSESNT
ncbi:head-tail connector protein [Akkermansia sp.]|uniref:head-tail connector protein n=1 Tax=Akkermansia sp. TaxID=1872421 RepID=UPI003A84D6EB